MSTMIPYFFNFFTLILHSISIAFQFAIFCLPEHPFTLFISLLLHMFDIVIFISITSALQKQNQEIIFFIIRKYLLLSTNSFLSSLLTSALWYIGYMAPFTTSLWKLITLTATLLFWVFNLCPFSCLFYVGVSTFYKKYGQKFDPFNQKILWFQLSFLLLFLDNKFWFVGIGTAAGLSMVYNFSNIKSNKHKKWNYYMMIVLSLILGYNELAKVLFEVTKVGLLTGINLLGSMFFVKKKETDNYITPIIFPFFEGKKLVKFDPFLENNSKSLLRVILQGNNFLCAFLFIILKNNSPLLLATWTLNSFFLISRTSYLQTSIKNNCFFLCFLVLLSHLIPLSTDQMVYYRINKCEDIKKYLIGGQILITAGMAFFAQKLKPLYCFLIMGGLVYLECVENWSVLVAMAIFYIF